MKKMLITLATIACCGLNYTYAAQKDICDYLQNPNGNYFLTADAKTDASLWYVPGSDGVSGGVGQKVDDHPKQKAPLIDSHCNNGKVELNWQQNGFSGHLVGNLDIEQARIIKLSNMTGNINNQAVNEDFFYQGIASTHK